MKPEEREESPAQDGEDEEETRAKAVSRDMELGLRDMEQRGQEVDDDLQDTREDWRRKQQDSSVPGAEPPDDGGS